MVTMTNSIAPPMSNAKIGPVYPAGTELVSLVVVVVPVDSLGELIGGVVVGEAVVKVDVVGEVVKDDVELAGLSIKKESNRDPLSKYADTNT